MPTFGKFNKKKKAKKGEAKTEKQIPITSCSECPYGSKNCLASFESKSCNSKRKKVKKIQEKVAA